MLCRLTETSVSAFSAKKPVSHVTPCVGLPYCGNIQDTVLGRANLSSVLTMLMRSQIRWAGLVVRMPDDRISKQILYEELTEGKRSHRGQNQAVQRLPQGLPQGFRHRHCIVGNIATVCSSVGQTRRALLAR